MEKCRCKCGEIIKLGVENVKYETLDRGYKFPYEQYYVICPKCSHRHDVTFKDLPFKVKWKKVFKGLLG